MATQESPTAKEVQSKRAPAKHFYIPLSILSIIILPHRVTKSKQKRTQCDKVLVIYYFLHEIFSFFSEILKGGNKSRSGNNLFKRANQPIERLFRSMLQL
jgi:hypothetical protein